VFGSHQGDVTSATFSHDGRRIVTTSEDRTARVWDINAADDAPIQVFDNHDKTVLHASFDRDARRVLTIAADHVARLWDIESGQLLAVYSGHVEAMSRAVLSPDGRRILTAGADGTARLWNTDIAPPVGVPAGGVRGGLLLRPVFAPDRRHVVTEIWGQRARVLDIGADGKEIAAFPDHPGRIRYAAFSGDGRRVLTVSEGEGRLWEIGKERPLVVLAIPEGQMHAAAFRPDGLRVATAHSDGAVWLWDPSSPKPIALLGRHADEATGVVFSADGRHVLTTSTDTTARLWDVDGRKQAALFSGHRRAVLDAAFSADGKRVITASEDATAALWDAATGQRLALYSADDNALAKAAISPNGQRVMTLSTNNWMRLWDAEAGTEIMKVSSGKDWSFAFSVDGKSIIAASVEGIARTWQVSLTMQELIDGVKSALPRCLTPDQRKAAFLEPAPPVWCITGAGREREADPAKWEPKWPYRTPEWRQWLVDMRAGKTVPPPAGQ
jgi:WD40 repeat protein